MIDDLTATSKIQNVQPSTPQGAQAQQQKATKQAPAQDSFALSSEAKRLMQEKSAKPNVAGSTDLTEKSNAAKPDSTKPQASQEAGKKPTQLLDANGAQAQLKNLSAEEQLQLTRLQTRDTEVRTHEQAHVAAGGGLTGKPSYTEQKGPDGKMYAIGGQVPIDMSEAETPEKTLEKARIIKAAALAPAQPSAEDRRIAAYAEQMAVEAGMQIEKTRMQNTAKPEAAETAGAASQTTNAASKTTGATPKTIDTKSQPANATQQANGAQGQTQAAKATGKQVTASAPKLQPGFSLKA